MIIAENWEKTDLPGKSEDILIKGREENFKKRGTSRTTLKKVKYLMSSGSITRIDNNYVELVAPRHLTSPNNI